jgi:hypothetical protein
VLSSVGFEASPLSEKTVNSSISNTGDMLDLVNNTGSSLSANKG